MAENGAIVNEDRLSSLPQFILISILSLLPMKSAASTSALSHRWRYLWTQIYHFSFKYDSMDEDEEISCQQAWTNMNHILRQLTSPKLTSFKLNIQTSQMTKQWSDLIVSWVPNILSRSLEHFEVEIALLDFYKQLTLGILPTCVFQCESLVFLHLGHSSLFDYKLPDDGIITLPNLKTLSCDIAECYYQLVQTLVKSCPVLEELKLIMQFETSDNLFEIFCPNLKRLKLEVGKGKLVNRFSIDTPKLEVLDVNCCESTPISFVNEYLSELVEARVQGRWCRSPMVNDHLVFLSKLLKIISGVNTLGWGYSLIGKIGDILPMFPNVTVLQYSSSDWSNLMPLLTRCPNLAFFKMNPLTIPVMAELEGVKVPDCVRNKLKRITTMLHRVTQDELKFLKYVLANARALEVLSVDGRLIVVKKNEELPEFCKKLFRLSRVSETCVVEFFGRYLSASSNNFINGSLEYKETGCRY